MAQSYATAADLALLWRPLSEAEEERAEALLPIVSDLLRQAAVNEGEDLDRRIAEGKTLASTAKAVTVDVCARILRQNTAGEAMSQESQTALGYTWQGTYAVPGGGMSNAIMKSDLKRLGIMRQRMRGVEMIDYRRCDKACGQD